MKQKIYYLNVLRLMATAAVVLLHTSAGICDNTTFTDNTNRMTFAFYKYAMQFSVPLFVLISGALFLSPYKIIDCTTLLRNTQSASCLRWSYLDFLCA